ncbi:allantoate permease [Chaetomidium leptoderma]|uniref:Allantoate permease n=1 Tax=Chaetomidium leptoderma TaxID=669021 RepID=A0AAN6VS13_9PEZI|nr:allantoate permease [Chaetomidium leptoderma]
MGHKDDGNPESIDSELGRVTDNSPENRAAQPVKTWKGYIWDTWELPQDQRRLLFKVDGFILTFASIGYFLKNLDQTNVNNAFLSGMKEDLGMYSNELVTSSSIWTAGYVIGQIPFNLLMTRVSPRWVIPSLELLWGIATVSAASIKDYKSLYALRFFVGFLESGFYPGIHYMLGSWYTPRELGKRAMIFWLAGTIGQMFSGFLQAAAYTNLNGVKGYSGWRWLFIIDGIITLPLAALGFIFLPNLPQGGKKTWWITEKEHELSIKRMESVGRAGKQEWTKEKVRKILLSWHTYLLPLLYILWNNGNVQNAMGFWLKSFNADPPPVPGKHFSVADINNLPLPITGIFVIMAATWGWMSDGICRGARWPFIYAGTVLMGTFAIVLKLMPLYENITGRMIVYWFSYIGAGAGPLILSWINEICADDTEKRAIVIAAAGDFAYIVEAVAPNFIWKTTDFPSAQKGYTWCIVLQCLLVLATATVQVLLRRDNKRAKAKAAAEVTYLPASPDKSEEALEDQPEKGDLIREKSD